MCVLSSRSAGWKDTLEPVGKLLVLSLGLAVQASALLAWLDLELFVVLKCWGSHTLPVVLLRVFVPDLAVGSTSLWEPRDLGSSFGSGTDHWWLWETLPPSVDGQNRGRGGGWAGRAQDVLWVDQVVVLGNGLNWLSHGSSKSGISKNPGYLRKFQKVSRSTCVP